MVVKKCASNKNERKMIKKQFFISITSTAKYMLQNLRTY